MFKTTAIALCFFTFVGCNFDGPGAPAYLEQNTAYQPIVNGTRVPQVVGLTDSEIMAIGWLYPEGDSSLAFCTGTLVAPDLVVTAAHCAYGASAGDIGFGVGLDPDDPDDLFLSSAIYVNREADAAMIKLAEDATAGEVEITPIAINDEAIDASMVGTAAQAGGYGDTYDESRDGRWFATVYVYEVSTDEIVVDGRGEQGICYGDSGSGLIHTNDEGDPVVLAVESWGDASCVDIDHMTRLDTIYDWIEPILAGTAPEDPCDGIGREGRCVENVAETCPRGTIQQVDCSTLGTVCTYVEQAERYGCACGELGEFAWCNGDTLESCRDGRVSSRNCVPMGGTCGWDEIEERYSCMESAVCRPEDEAGRCEGNTYVTCSDGVTTRELCYMENDGICVETEDGAGCVEGPAEGDEDGDMGEDLYEADALGDVQGDPDAAVFPDLGDLADGADADAGIPDDGKKNDDCGGCAAAGGRSVSGLAMGAILAMLVAIRRRRRA